MGAVKAGHLAKVLITDSGLVEIGNVKQVSKGDPTEVGESTTKDSGRVREFDGVSFLKGHQITFSGLTNDSPGFVKLLSVARSLADVSEVFQFLMADGKTHTGACFVGNIGSGGGTAEAHETFSCTLTAVNTLVTV